MISNVYSKSNIHSSPSVHRQAQVILYERLLPLITKQAQSLPLSAGVDVHDLLNATTMDSICAYLFGLKNGSNFLQNEPYRRYWFQLYHSRKTYTFFPQELPRLTDFCKMVGINLIPTWVDDANRELESWCKERCDATSAYIKEGLSANDTDPANQPVVFEALLNGIKREEKTKGMDSVLYPTTLAYPELSIASEMIDHLAAGHETSGITLTYITWQLSRDLPLQEALRKELLTLEPNMKLENSKTQPIPNPKDLDSLPLLHAILMETLRLRAAIPGGQPRMTPFPSCILGGYEVPGGVRVGAQAHSVHRNAEVFPEPEKWEWRRWLDGEGSWGSGNGDSEEVRRERDRWFWAFSSGGRMCVGSNFAVYGMFTFLVTSSCSSFDQNLGRSKFTYEVANEEVDIKLIVAAIYSNFRTHIVDDEGIEQTDGYTCGPTRNKLFLRFESVE